MTNGRNLKVISYRFKVMSFSLVALTLIIPYNREIPDQARHNSLSSIIFFSL